VEILRIVVTVLFAIDALVLAVIILMQEGKSAGLTGTISGMADTYWGKNKGRSMEGKLEKITKILAVVFFVLALALNMSWGR
jgi:preprotein translocase subunit SecG